MGESALHPSTRLSHRAPDHFDVVILDEFHHATTRSYERLLDHVAPACCTLMFKMPPTHRPRPLDDSVRRRMERQGRRDTTPEIALRRELHRRGLRYRVDRSPIKGMRSRADLVFGPSRVAVFVDGCFWHSCPIHGSLPVNNRAWWQAKLAGNIDRDRRVDRQLTQAGWLPLRVWEHLPVREAADRIESAVLARRL